MKVQSYVRNPTNATFLFHTSLNFESSTLEQRQIDLTDNNEMFNKNILKSYLF
jgi:hypothetical protein